MGDHLFTVAPCRAIDTRQQVGPYGGPSLAAGTSRAFVLAGQCGIPSTAIAVSVNVTVTMPSAGGYLTLYPNGLPVPNVSTINYRAGQTRANNAIVVLGVNGDLAVYCAQSSGTVDFILDVNGYFR